ncbi:hypothetical protein EYC84_002927 [Monilinia fructicola]|uniref:DUF8035 domain-containing protein n=1 Tax=Monilinia fructicola TaxID=38448 RepID=A0A5M9JSS1_MONFR|nr:hypothetical protein EYC84_002927 [Monilinia fructicola]
MSFGASPSDIIIVITSCRELYRRCRSAGGEYDEISREVRGLHNVLKHLKSEVEDEDSLLNRVQSIWERQLAPIIGDCDITLKQLDGLLLKYGRLSEGSGGGNGSTEALWEKMRRVLTLFLDNIQLHENAGMAKNLNVQGEQLDVILDKVDHIAAKISKRAKTPITSLEDDDKEVWKQFRRELISEGFSNDVLQQHKDVLRAYIRQMELDGLLGEEPLRSQMPSPVSSHTERWVDSTNSESSRGNPPFFAVVDTGDDFNRSKEIIQREDNMKFPTSMKSQRPRPESRLESDFAEEKWEKDTSGSESSDISSKHQRISSSNSSIIQTSELLPFSATPLILPPSSPSSHHSYPDESIQPIALRPKRSSDQRSSPRTSGVRFDLPVRQTSPKLSTFVTGTSPRPDSAMPSKRLAPDSYGNEISPDAKWTKVKRSLISPEVLNQDGRRYEARPEFVAILGILTKEEIQDYVSRSHNLREERWRRHHQASIGPEQRSRRERSSRTRRGRNSSASESSSCSSDTTSDSDSDSEDDRRSSKRRDPDETERRRHNREYRRRYQGDRGDRKEESERRERTERKERDREPSENSSPNSVSYTPQPQLFSSSPQSGSSNTPRPWNIPGSNQLPQGYPPPPFPPQQGYTQQLPYPMQGQQYPQGPPYPAPQQYLSPHPYLPHTYSTPQSPSSPTYFPPSSSQSNRPYNHNYHPHRHRHHHSHHSRDRDRDRDLAHSDSHKSRNGGSRWRDHLTAAGLGGAAVGLLNVLSEAADGF